MAPPGERLDPYATVHKALRHQLAEALLELSNTDWSDTEATQRTIDTLVTALRSQAEHARHEDAFYHTLLEARAPGSTAVFGVRHRQLADRIDDLDATLEGLADHLPVDEDAAYELYLTFARFVADYFVHLDDEERGLKPLFWEHCSDDELGALEDQVQAAVEPGSMEAMIPHFLLALDAPELIDWLGGMRDGAPPDVFAKVCAVGADLVPTRTWARVSTELGLG